MAFAEIRIGLPRGMGLLFGDRLDDDSGATEKRRVRLADGAGVGFGVAFVEPKKGGAANVVGGLQTVGGTNRGTGCDLEKDVFGARIVERV